MLQFDSDAPSEDDRAIFMMMASHAQKLSVSTDDGEGESAIFRGTFEFTISMDDVRQFKALTRD